MTEVLVSAPARLHLGMLDPAGLGERRFGGFGVAIEAPRVVVAIRWAPEIDRAPGPSAPGGVVASGPQAERAAGFARSVRTALGLTGTLRLEVREAIAPHIGLGSGTKLGLAVARGIFELADRPADPELLARSSGRGARSSVGAWTFAGTGLVVEAGVTGDGGVSPLLMRCAMPESWRCVLVRPTAAEGISGDAEERFFVELQRARPAEPPVARLLLTSLLPGLQRGDIDEFGAALSEIQRAIGAIFADQQGGIFHPSAAPLIEALEVLGVGAVGQSSWGPTVYGIVADPERADAVARHLRERAGASASVTVVAFARRGAVCERIGPEPGSPGPGLGSGLGSGSA
jgi:beta-ribofuranosylaminobenzene 5'-phosphate synthase